MHHRGFCLLPLIGCLAATCAAGGSDERYPIGRSSNDFVEISGNLLMDKDQIKQAVGTDITGSQLGDNIVVVQVTVRPLGDDPVKIWLDDFLLLSDKDGQRAAPFQPSQIAGAGAIVVKDGKTQKSSSMGQFGPIIGMPYGGPAFGDGTSAHPSADIEVKDADATTESPLLVALRQKVLPEKSVTEPVTGLLFFEIDGKMKPKNLELFYKTPSGKLGMRFAPENAKEKEKK